MKKIVLLSDGTGNGAAKRHKTNVWRLYEALDLHSKKNGCKQIAFYDDGVGSQEFLPLKILGGAFGWGLKKNVIELYKFLCRTYKQGDKVYLFGFSRGAFTVRMLVGMVNYCGICCYKNEEDLRRTARDNFQAYRWRNDQGTEKRKGVLGRWCRKLLLGGNPCKGGTCVGKKFNSSVFGTPSKPTASQ